jgi:putative FmdB family regulatory protein
MPAYEYLCDACATHFEKRQKMSDAAIELCPECGGHVHRLISGGAGAITKGAASAQPMRACVRQWRSLLRRSRSGQRWHVLRELTRIS